MPKSPLSFVVNADNVASAIGAEFNAIKKDLQKAVQGLAIQTHAKVIEEAQKELKGWHLGHFLGDNKQNVTWTKASDNLWVVSIDEKVMHYNDGAPSRSMLTDDWLLKNAKVSKDGLKYKIIPFKHNITSKPTAEKAGVPQMLGQMAKNVIQQARTPEGRRISLRTIERNPDGTPKIGILHKIPVQPPLPQQQAPQFFSKPRSEEMARLTGLKAHEGIFKLEGLVVSQRMQGAKVKREAVTFRVASEKQKAEGRWMVPPVRAGNFLEKAFRFATQEAWPQMLKEVEENFKRRNGK